MCVSLQPLPWWHCPAALLAAPRPPRTTHFGRGRRQRGRRAPTSRWPEPRLLQSKEPPTCRCPPTHRGTAAAAPWTAAAGGGRRWGRREGRQATWMQGLGRPQQEGGQARRVDARTWGRQRRPFVSWLQQRDAGRRGGGSGRQRCCTWRPAQGSADPCRPWLARMPSCTMPTDQQAEAVSPSSRHAHVCSPAAPPSAPAPPPAGRACTRAPAGCAAPTSPTRAAPPCTQSSVRSRSPPVHSTGRRGW